MERKRVQITIAPDTHEMLRKLAAENDTTVSGMVTLLTWKGRKRKIEYYANKEKRRSAHHCNTCAGNTD